MLGMRGNPADYGFGRSMQDIITQLMNQSGQYDYIFHLDISIQVLLKVAIFHLFHLILTQTKKRPPSCLKDRGSEPQEG